MPKINILTESDLRQVINLDADAVACVENAFRSLTTKAVIMPPILHLEIADANGEVDVKTAYVPGLDSFAMKMSPDSSTTRNWDCPASMVSSWCFPPRPGWSRPCCSIMAT